MLVPPSSPAEPKKHLWERDWSYDHLLTLTNRGEVVGFTSADRGAGS